MDSNFDYLQENTASWQVNGLLLAVSFLALAVGILSSAWSFGSSVSDKPTFMARHVNGLPQPRTKVRAR